MSKGQKLKHHVRLCKTEFTLAPLGTPPLALSSYNHSRNQLSYIAPQTNQLERTTCRRDPRFNLQPLMLITSKPQDMEN